MVLPTALMVEAPSMYMLAVNKEDKVADCWVLMGEGGNWNINLRRNLNDWEMEEMTLLLGLVENIC